MSAESADILSSPVQHAREAGLRYVYDSDPGLTRKRRGKGFAFYDEKGAILKDGKQKRRCRALAVPPAWRRVWICRFPDGHIQATGYDARGRKQYIYHPDWRIARDETKFENMLVFGKALPQIRRRVLESLNRDGLPREKVVAAVVRLLDKTGLRVGNDAYSAENATFGLTTIRKRHYDMHGQEIWLDFPAKGGKVWRGKVTDAKLARVISECSDLPGYRLFKYLGEDKTPVSIGSADINRWLQETTGQRVSAKDFRTWNACVLFLEEAMRQTGCPPAEPPRAGQGGPQDTGLQLKPVLEKVAARLGNTPAILQKSYVHPELVDLYRTGCLLNRKWMAEGNEAAPAGLRKTEALLMRWLESRYAGQRGQKRG